MLNKRKPCIKLTDTNCNIIPLNVAAERAAETGAFMLAEKSGIGSYESDTVDIKAENITDMVVSKVQAALRGLEFIKEATADKTTPVVESTPVVEPAPAAE